MAKGNPLQEQLLKAGLVKKSKVAEVAREQQKSRLGKAPPTSGAVQRDAELAREEKASRDRALAAEHKAQAQQKELAAQVRQIIQDKRIPPSGEIDYRFSADGAIRSVQVSEETRRKLAVGALVIARHGERYEVLPRAAGDKVRERDASLVVLDHGVAACIGAVAGNDEDAAYYAQFKVPDDLVW